MQTPTQTAPPADVAPALAPALPAPVTITTVGPDGKPQTLAIPRSTEEVEALLAQRQELAGQLTNVSERRTRLAAELGETHEPAARTGLESRLALLDQRIIQIETDLAGIGRQLSAAPAEFVALAEVSGSPGDSEYEQGLMAGGFTGLALALVVVGFVARRAWKRRTRSVPAQLSGDSGQRLERLEHGMDAIALEIERISEGQRFVTKLLSESQSSFGEPQRLPKGVHAEREDPAKR